MSNSIKDRPNFLCEFEFLGDKTPGPGNYHPRVTYFIV